MRGIFYGRFLVTLLALGLTACEPPSDDLKMFLSGLTAVGEGLGELPEGSTENFIQQVYSQP